MYKRLTGQSIGTVACCCLFGAHSGWAQNTFNTVAITATDANVNIDLNDQTLFAKTNVDGESFSLDVSRMLVNGANTIDVDVQPPAGYNPLTDPPPRATIRLRQRTQLPGEYRNIFFASAVIANGTLNQGTFDSSTDEMTFGPSGSDFVWDFTFSGADAYDRIPTKLTYFLATIPVAAMTVEFSTAGGGQLVRYENIPTRAGPGEIDFSSLVPTVGGAFLNSAGFSRVKFSYTGATALKWRTLYLERWSASTLFSLTLPGQDVFLTQEVLDNGTVTTGTATEARLSFADLGGNWEWAFTFGSEDEYGRVPSHLYYRASNFAVGSMTIEFANGGDTHVVTYGNVSMPATGEGELIDLSQLVPSGGAQWLDELDFSKIRFSYAAPNQQLELLEVALLYAATSHTASYSFNVNVPQTWAWQSAQVMPDPLPVVERVALQAEVLNLHAAMVAKDADTVAGILDQKARDMAKLRYTNQNAAITEQRDFFRDVVFSKPGWGMEPLNAGDLVYNVIAGGKIVQVTHAVMPHPLRSLEVLHRGSTNRFNIDIYASKIPDGMGGFEWKIIR